MNNTIRLLPYFDKGYPGTVAKICLIVAVAFLVFHLILTRNRRDIYGTRVPSSLQNACIVGLGLACLAFTFHVFALEVEVIRSLLPEWATLVSQRTLPNTSEVGDVAILQLASILVIFSAFWYSFPYRSQARRAIREFCRLVFQLPLLNRIDVARNWVPFSTPIEQYPDLDDLPPRLEKHLQDSLILSQFGVYLVVLANLWALAFMGVGVTMVTFITAVFFFVMDDWVIISDYSRALKGRMFASHNLRITATNLVLTAALLFTIVQTYNWFGSIVSIVPLTVFLFWRYRLAHRVQDRLAEYAEQYAEHMKLLEEDVQRHIEDLEEQSKFTEAEAVKANQAGMMRDWEEWRSQQ